MSEERFNSEGEIPSAILSEIAFDWMSDALNEHRKVRDSLMDRYGSQGREQLYVEGATIVRMSWSEDPTDIMVETVIETAVVPGGINAELLASSGQNYLDSQLAMLVDFGGNLDVLANARSTLPVVNLTPDTDALARQIALARQELNPDDPLVLSRFQSTSGPSVLQLNPVELGTRQVTLLSRVDILDMRQELDLEQFSS